METRSNQPFEKLRKYRAIGSLLLILLGVTLTLPYDARADNESGNIVEFDPSAEYGPELAGMGDGIPFPESIPGDEKVDIMHASVLGCLMADGSMPPGFNYGGEYSPTIDDFGGTGHAVPVLSRIFNSKFYDEGIINVWCMDTSPNENFPSNHVEALISVFNYATEHGIDIVTMAKITGVPEDSCDNEELFQALGAFVDSGGIFMPSVSNWGPGSITCPSNLWTHHERPGVLPVGSIGPSGEKSGFSGSGGEDDDIMYWVGEGVQALDSVDGGYTRFTGTSMAVGEAATIVARLWRLPQNSDKTNLEMVGMMRNEGKSSVPNIFLMAYPYRSFLPLVSK
ncbi:S8/S53 family peptidase [Candidatus Dojkabacteria bacterium]|uniref:S8/S53 family peptidase n=1 Tax=Candidatus Dojkabacteria bacterium TaxID=2099670 RepID=A0A955RKS0_9BACT|nr:S8/S53 family peptidase [Candidatus Dojkabacteria bacterium]